MPAASTSCRSNTASHWCSAKTRIRASAANWTATSKSFNSATASPRAISWCTTRITRGHLDCYIDVFHIDNGATESDLVVHDAHHPRPSYAFLLSHMEHRPGFPTPIGVFRAWDDLPRYEDVMNQQIKDVIAKRGPGDLAKLLRAGDTWEVK